jgi:hypothetical protein
MQVTALRTLTTPGLDMLSYFTQGFVLTCYVLYPAVMYLYLSSNFMKVISFTKFSDFNKCHQVVFENISYLNPEKMGL